MDKNICWLHLSDLHMAEVDYKEKGKVLFKLWEDIKKMQDNFGLNIDMIFFSGDIAMSGQWKQYEIAKDIFFDPLLNLTKLSNDKIFFVPGNHDSDRGVSKMLINPLSQLKDEESLCKLLEAPEHRNVFLMPFRNYKLFIESFTGVDKEVDQAFSYTKTIKVRDIRISILGLNSAIFSGFNKASKGTIEDKGYLAITDSQLKSTLQPHGNEDLYFCIMHHPFEYLIDFDRYAVENRIKSFSNIMLHGHTHNPDVSIQQNLSGKNIIVPAGAVHEQPLRFCGYNISQINFSSETGSIHFRRFNHKRCEWIKDIETTGDQLDGTCSFKLHPPIERNASGLDRYSISFDAECIQNLLTLSLTKEMVIEMFSQDIRSHKGYYDYDLEEYPFPVKESYIFYINKVGKQLTFRRIVRSTKNYNKLSQWHIILSLYRRLLRMEYRKDPANYVFRLEKIKNMILLHSDLKDLLIEYFNSFETVNLSSLVEEINNSKSVHDIHCQKEMDIAYHISESIRSCSEVEMALYSIDSESSSIVAIRGDIVMGLECSLQHFHKILLSYAPIE